MLPDDDTIMPPAPPAHCGVTLLCLAATLLTAVDSALALAECSAATPFCCIPLTQGYLYVNGPATRYFQLNSTDGSRLFIGGLRVINFDGTHDYTGSRTVGYSFPTRHRYAIQVEYFKVRHLRPHRGVAASQNAIDS